MAGTHITIDVDDRNVRQMLERLLGRATDMTPAMHNIGEALVHATWRRFEAEKGPDDKSWHPLSENYKAHRAGGTEGNTLRRRGPDGQVRMRVDFLRRLAHQKILNATSRLKDSIAYQADTQGVTVGTNVEYAAIQQLGGTIRPKNKKFLRFEINGQIIFAKQVTIPARPFLGINEADERTIGDIVASFLS